jgi:cbb3-type cytochrome oxidase maturation protein
MDILYLLIPLSAVLVLGIVAVFGWAVHGGQFDDLEREGQRLIVEDPESLDEGQGRGEVAPQQSSRRPE